MKKALLIVGIVGMVLSMAVVLVSFGLHLSSPNHITLEEAMLGIAPGFICCALFAIVAGAGLLMIVLMKEPEKSSESTSRSKRRARDEDDD